MKHKHGMRHAMLVIPSTFEDCLTYEMQIMYLKKYIDDHSAGNLEAIVERLNEIEKLLSEMEVEDIQAELANINAELQVISQKTDNLQEIKQDKLTFDDTPKAGSKNPVTSEGIKTALDAISAGGVVLDDTVTPSSSNGVKSSGIYTYVENVKTDINSTIGTRLTQVETKIESVSADSKTQSADIENLKSRVTKTESDIASLDISAEDIEELKSEVKSATDTVSNFDTRLTQDEATINRLNEVQVAHVGLIQQLETDSSQNKTLATEAKTTAEEAKQTAEATESVAREAKTAADSATGSVADLTTKVEENKTNIGLNKTEIDSLDHRVESAEDSIIQLETSKQDKLTFDDTPKADSNNPVTSKGIYNAIQSASPDGITARVEALETKQTQQDSKINSIENDLTNVKAYDSRIATNEEAIGDLEAGKQDKLTFDNTPRLGSQNPVTSEGIKAALDSISAAGVVLDDDVTQDSQNGVKSSGIYEYVTSSVTAAKDELSGEISSVQADYEEVNRVLGTKQNALTFDSTPTAGSQNPVTSEGIKSALDAISAGEVVLDDTVTENSQNGVKSSGIYNYVEPKIGEMMNDLETTRNQLSNTDRRVGDLENTTENLSADFGVLQSYINDLGGRVNVAESGVATNKSNIEQNATEIGTLKSQYGELENSFNATRDQVGQLDEKVQKAMVKNDLWRICSIGGLRLTRNTAMNIYTYGMDMGGSLNQTENIYIAGDTYNNVNAYIIASDNTYVLPKVAFSTNRLYLRLPVGFEYNKNDQYSTKYTFGRAGKLFFDCYCEQVGVTDTYNVYFASGASAFGIFTATSSEGTTRGFFEITAGTDEPVFTFTASEII